MLSVTPAASPNENSGMKLPSTRAPKKLEATRKIWDRSVSISVLISAKQALYNTEGYIYAGTNIIACMSLDREPFSGRKLD